MISDIFFTSYAAKMLTKSFKSASKKFEFCTNGFTNWDNGFKRLEPFYFSNVIADVIVKAMILCCLSIKFLTFKYS